MPPSDASVAIGDVSAPVFSAVMGAALRMMAVPPDGAATMKLATPAAEPARAKAPVRAAAPARKVAG